jgi:integrase
MLTGKRRGALSAMRWDEISEDGTWTPPTDPRRRRRTKRVHAIPLPGLVLRVIKPLRPEQTDQDAGPYVFPGRGTHLCPGSRLADEVKAKSRVEDFFFHALRHTLETRFAALKVPPHIRDLILDHAPHRGAGAGYDHHTYRDEMADALELWAKHIESVVLPKGARILR